VEFPAPSGSNSLRVGARLCREALAALPAGQAEVVTLRHLHDWSLADIAVHVGRSGSATAGLLHRGMQQLRSLLHEEE
jgi:DNA-directed RNA polymerase specialized sigma24 family protein